MKYVYPAIFYKDKKLPDTYSVIFPDIKGAATCGYSLYDAIFMAEDALAGMLAILEDENKPIPNATPIDKIIANPDEFSSSAFITLIKADTDKFRMELEQPQPEKNFDDDWIVPETLAREILKIAGVS